MEPMELLEQGRKILAPILESHGFVYERGVAEIGSGGAFARGAFVRLDHRLEFSVRGGLGEVVYRVGETRIAHEALMREIAGPRQARYPGFSDEPLDGFRHLRDALEQYGKSFLRTMDEDFYAFAARALQGQSRGGFGRLSDAEAG